MHNASAVIRSCECFGVQDVHIIETRNDYIINKEIDEHPDTKNDK